MQLFVLCREGGTDLPDGTVINDHDGPIQVRRVVNNFRDVYNFAGFHHNAENEAHFRAFVAEVQPDLIHFQHCIGLSTSMLAAARELRIPHLMTLHDYWFICPQVQLLDRQGQMCGGPLKGLNCRRCAWWPMESTLLKKRSFQLAEQVLHRLPLQLAERAARPLTDYVLRHPEENAGLLPLIERAWVIKQLLLEVPLLLSPSQFLRQMYADYGIPSARLRVLPLGLDKRPWQPAVPHTPRTGPLRLGYIGTLMAHKGVHVLLEGLRQLPTDQVELQIYGYGEPGASYVARLEAEAGPNVHFVGRYENHRLPQLLAELDAIVIPSVWHETFSIVAREALLSGVPVIASDVGALPELITANKNGLLFPVGDSAAFAAVVRRLISDDLHFEIDRAQVDRDVWDIERHIAELQQVYAEVLAAQRPA